MRRKRLAGAIVLIALLGSVAMWVVRDTARGETPRCAAEPNLAPDPNAAGVGPARPTGFLLAAGGSMRAMIDLVGNSVARVAHAEPNLPPWVAWLDGNDLAGPGPTVMCGDEWMDGAGLGAVVACGYSADGGGLSADVPTLGAVGLGGWTGRGYHGGPGVYQIAGSSVPPQIAPGLPTYATNFDSNSGVASSSDGSLVAAATAPGSAPPANQSVPEPGTLSVFLLAALAALRRRHP